MRDMIKLRSIQELIWRGFKFCNGCNFTRPLDNFGIDVTKKNRFNSRCKMCRAQKEFSRRHTPEIKEKIKEYKMRPKNRARTKELALKRLFNLSIEQYNAILHKQHGGCAICSKVVGDKRGRSLAVDHDHKNGLVRGLLCTNCNMGIGNLQDSVELLKAAIIYLEKGHYHV